MKRKARTMRCAALAAVVTASSVLVGLSVGGGAALAKGDDPGQGQGGGHGGGQGGGWDHGRGGGEIFGQTNAAPANSIVAYHRSANGSLSEIGEFPTFQSGSGPAPDFPFDPLTSQGAIQVNDQHTLVFNVNAGSNTVTAMRINRDGSLTLVGTASSGGVFPVSLTTHGDSVYVLNAGLGGSGDAARGNISGLHIGRGGSLSPIPGSSQPLSGADTLFGNSVLPSVISYSPDGRILAVTEKATDKIDTYVVRHDVASAPIVSPSAGKTPFGAAFAPNGEYVVTDASIDLSQGFPNPIPDTAGASSYWISRNGTLHAISTVSDHQTAACWVAFSPDGRYAYLSNALQHFVTGTDDSLSTFGIGRDGSLRPTTASGISVDTGAFTVPDELVQAGGVLYVLSLNLGGLQGYRIGHDGSLTPVPGASVGGLPGHSAQGLAGF